MKAFISHSSLDKRFVRTLKEDLNENGIETWFDEDELELGDTLAEKLEIALEGSSHFLIVLSQASINSDWVKFELQKAIQQKDNAIIQKIIPIKYRDCEVPDDLGLLLYTDLSKEVRLVQGNKVVFTSQAYDHFVEKLCRAIRNSEREFTSHDKKAFKKEITSTKSVDNDKRKLFIKAKYNINGYVNQISRLSYADKIIKKAVNKDVNADSIRPILLPPLLKSVFKNLEVGDKIAFSKNYGVNNEFGQFAGYRKDDLAITVDYRIRKLLDLKKGISYNVEIDFDERRIILIDNL